jgi:hypothetical protein
MRFGDEEQRRQDRGDTKDNPDSPADWVSTGTSAMHNE